MSLSKELGLQKEEDWSDLKYCLTAVKQDGYALQFVKEQTPEICLTAVKQNGYALQFVKEQTPEICLEAVKENGYALEFVKEQTPEICLEAVKQDGRALQFVQNQTPEICLIAVKQDGRTLQFVKEQTPEICLEAVKRNGRALYAVNFIDTNVLPIKDWDVEWFKHIENVELKRKFIKERGKEVFKELNPKVIDENDEYCLIQYKLDDNTSKALLFRCPSSNDLYFQEVDPSINDLEDALKFLNNNISKEELAYES